MTTFTESEYIGEWLKAAFDFPNYCVQELTIAQDPDATDPMVSGTVLELDSSSSSDSQDGMYVVCTSGSSADAILIEPITAELLSAGDVIRPCLVRGPARIDSDHITIDSGQKADALVALAALNIIAVNSALTTWNVQTL